MKSDQQGVQAVIRSCVVDGQSCVVKSPKPGLLKLFSQWTLKREAAVYARLDGVAGVPKCYGLRPDGLVLEAIDGKPVSAFRQGDLPASFFDELDSIIARLHARGIAHSDLKKRDNILVVPHPDHGRSTIDDRQTDITHSPIHPFADSPIRPFADSPTPPLTPSPPLPLILDFGAAFLRGHPLFETFRRIDLAAAAKLRNHHQPQSMTDAHRAALANPTWAERLSRFLIRWVRDPWRQIF